MASKQVTLTKTNHALIKNQKKPQKTTDSIKIVQKVLTITQADNTKTVFLARKERHHVASCKYVTSFQVMFDMPNFLN